MSGARVCNASQLVENMGIINTGKFGFDEIRKRLSRQGVQSDDRKLKRWLSYIGEELCNHARTVTPGHSSGGYDDQTGNLRSSIGYRIYKNGETVKDGGFRNVGTGSGVKDAKKALDDYGLAHEIPLDGWTIVIVAGMSYATYVEAKGFNVLHLTKVEMEEKIEKLKKQLKL